MPTAAIVPAAGLGLRLGAGGPKALRLLGGEPLLLHAVRALAACRDVVRIVVAAPADETGAVRSLLASALAGSGTGLSVVPGGAERQDSVALGLAAVAEDIDVVLVHDAARPLVPVALVQAVIAAVQQGALAVVPGVPVADTVRRIADDGLGSETLDRTRLRAVQTPQGFPAGLLREAHARARADGWVGTDDAGLVERLGHPVHIVAGDAEALKVTTPLDLLLAEALLARRREHR